MSHEESKAGVLDDLNDVENMEQEQASTENEERLGLAIPAENKRPSNDVSKADEAGDADEQNDTRKMKEQHTLEENENKCISVSPSASERLNYEVGEADCADELNDVEKTEVKHISADEEDSHSLASSPA
eukprot:13548453-Ditylum_brightwellii.AAC.1